MAQRIPEDELAEHWFAFKHRLVGQLQSAFRRVSLEKGLTQKDIADRLGMDPAFISRCLRGQQDMTVRAMHDLARATGCRLDVTVRPLDVTLQRTLEEPV
jgi:transcriptional regulator with XRE-family HTH domain